MASYIKTWDETNPAGSRARSLGDDDIRDFKYAIRERLAQDHSFEVDETGITTIGYHKKTTLIVQASDPTVVADAGIVYTKDVSAKAELFWEDEDGNTLQITSGGILKDGCPSGFIGMWSGTIATIPSGWVICDGNNSTPNLLAKFIRGVATAATNPGTTGGADTHTHAAGTYSGPSHTHTVPRDGWGGDGNVAGRLAVYTGGMGLNLAGQNNTSGSGGTGAITGTSASASTLPVYYELAFIYKS